MSTTGDTRATSAAATATAELIDSIWVASALASALGGPALAEEDPAAEVLAAAGLVEQSDTGWVLSEPLGPGARPERIAMVREQLIGALGQAATIAVRGAGRGWEDNSDEVLLAAGRLSAARGLGGNFATYINATPELAAAFGACPVIIDVGVGVAAGACAMCEGLPQTRVIGLDVNARALALARQLVAAKGLGDRIELRLQGVEELRDVGVASLAHIPPRFIPRPALSEGIDRLYRALRPGGLVFVSGISSDSAIERWQAYNTGGSAVTLAECAALLRAAGFEQPKPAPNLPPEAPMVVLATRP
ncbi:MAG: methyltransferase domain-containing protein [Solirubrobacterales bacterium]|nr:methyltransferase domain-containing protein [Solirubrobacterales bacterium]